MRITGVNITLVRSESISASPTPLSTCDFAFQNLAYGGRVKDTDCPFINSSFPQGAEFFGQVDTSAVLIVYGLGKARSNISADAIDEGILNWLANNAEKMDNLLLSRGFIVGIDPSLVTVQVSSPSPAISYLQIFLVVLTGFLALAAWILQSFCTSAPWGSSLFVNLVFTTQSTPQPVKRSTYIHKVPKVELLETTEKTWITIGEATIREEGCQLNSHISTVVEHEVSRK